MPQSITIGGVSPAEDVYMLVMRNATRPTWAVVNVGGLTMPGENNSFISMDIIVNLQQSPHGVYTAPVGIGPVHFEMRGLAPFCPLAGSVSGPALFKVLLVLNAFYGVSTVGFGYVDDKVTFFNSVITSITVSPFGPNVPFSSVSIRGISQW